jgi:hypothetical protein
LRRQPFCRAGCSLGVIPEISIDLGLHDLAANLFARIGVQPQSLQTLVDRIEMPII